MSSDSQPLYLCPVDRSAVDRWHDECRLALVSIPAETPDHENGVE